MPTREEMENAILVKGKSVLWGGKSISRVDDLPTQEQIDASSESQKSGSVTLPCHFLQVTATAPDANDFYSPYMVLNGKLYYQGVISGDNAIFWDGAWKISTANGLYYQSSEDVPTPDLVNVWEIGGNFPDPDNFSPPQVTIETGLALTFEAQDYLSSERKLTISVGDADRRLSLKGNLSLIGDFSLASPGGLVQLVEQVGGDRLYYLPLTPGSLTLASNKDLPRIAYIGSVSTNDTALSNPSSLDVEAGQVYKFRLVLHLVAGGGGWKISLYGGEGLDVNLFLAYTEANNLDTNTVTRFRDNGIGFSRGATTAGNFVITCEGTFHVVEAGNLHFGIALNSANAASTSTIQGSFLELTKMGG